MTSRPGLLAALLALLGTASAARAAPEQACSPALLATLGAHLKVARFTPDRFDLGTAPKGVIVVNACKRLPADPGLTLTAVGWDAGKPDSKALVVALVDEKAGQVVAEHRDEVDEDAASSLEGGAVHLDTAAYDLAPGVRAVGVDVFSRSGSCGEGGEGASRTLYVREGHALRPVLQGLAMSQYLFLQGNTPRCTPPDDKDRPILESYDVVIALGNAGAGGWRDLLLTVTATRDDHKPSKLKPLHVRVPYAGGEYPLAGFDKAYAAWRK